MTITGVDRVGTAFGDMAFIDEQRRPFARVCGSPGQAVPRVSRDRSACSIAPRASAAL